MITVLILLIILGILLVLGWAAYKFGLFNEVLGDEELFGEPEEAEPQHMDVTVALPSQDVYFQFTCKFRLEYTPTASNRTGKEPSISSVESALYTAGKELSTELSLPQKDQLKHELTDAFREQRTLPSNDYVITAYCEEVEVDPKQLEAIARNYNEELGALRLQRRVNYLGTVFEDPRISTMWWLAQNGDKIDELPKKAELLYRLDRRLNPNTNPSDLPICRDLDVFLEEADDAERAAIGVALAGIYRRYGHDELADEAERLIPNRTLPSRNGSKPENSDAEVPSQPAGQ